MYALQNPDEGVEEPESEKLGDLREPLDCEYVVGMGWVGRKSCLIAGKHSESALRLVPFEMTAKPKSEMEFGFLPSNFRLDTSEMILLAGAHGEDIVRDVYIDAEVRVRRYVAVGNISDVGSSPKRHFHAEKMARSNRGNCRPATLVRKKTSKYHDETRGRRRRNSGIIRIEGPVTIHRGGYDNWLDTNDRLSLPIGASFHAE